MKIAKILTAAALVLGFSSAHAVDLSNETEVCGEFRLYMCANFVGYQCPDFVADNGATYELIGTTKQAKSYITGWDSDSKSVIPSVCVYTNDDLNSAAIHVNYIGARYME